MTDNSEDYYTRRKKGADPDAYERMINALPRVRLEKKRGPDEIGYGKPPKATQFKPGHSGNPKGRPKGKTNVRTEIERLLLETVEIHVGNRVRKVPRVVGMITSALSRAMKGDHKAYLSIATTAKEFGLFDKRPERPGFGNLEGLTDQELEEFDRLISKSQMTTVPE